MVTPPRIASNYLDRLLTQDDAVEAVATLAGFWSHRIQADFPAWGLSPTEYRTQLVLIYTGWVGNGGHAQLLANRPDFDGTATVAALCDVGLPELASILASVRRAQGTSADAIQDADRSAFGIILAADSRLQAHLRANRHDILRPEQGFP